MQTPTLLVLIVLVLVLSETDDNFTRQLSLIIEILPFISLIIMKSYDKSEAYDSLVNSRIEGWLGRLDRRGTSGENLPPTLCVRLHH